MCDFDVSSISLPHKIHFYVVTNIFT